MNPTVSFVVPCYKLAHLLSECVESILAQTYGDFEVLIMDDCSPDNTPEVAQSFGDSRVKHIRNEPNLGHLRNYNKGIELSRGKYVWLISADDKLRRDHVLHRYIQMFESNEQVGFVFCPGVRLREGKEIEILDYSVHGNRDQIFDGRQFLSKLIQGNSIVAASGMVRMECYERVSVFPLDMPWAGDWYLWCVFSLHFDVGYLAEPMVCYREHDLSMTNHLMKEEVTSCVSEDVAMPWVIKQKVEEAGYQNLSKDCLLAAANEYARSMMPKRYRWRSTVPMTPEQFEDSLNRHLTKTHEKKWVRARVYVVMADRHYWKGELKLAIKLYISSLRSSLWMPKVWAKLFLVCFGRQGKLFREKVKDLRRSSFTRQVADGLAPGSVEM